MRRALLLLVAFVGLTVLHTWPLAGDISGLSRLDNDDAGLNVFVVSWVAHIVPRNPLALFDAPIFFPERHTLAYSEHMLVPSLMGAPLIWAGRSPVLVYNVLIMLGFALSGWAMYLVMSRWTGSQWAGVIAGLLYAFNAHVLTRFVHLQALHVEFFPLVLYAFDRVLTDRRLRDALLLAIAFVLQALCSNYLLVFTTYALIASALARWRELGTRPQDPRPPGPQDLAAPAVYWLAASAVISMVALAPFLWPYYQVDREYGLARAADVVTQYNAGWRDYLVTGGRMHYAWWSHTFYEGRTALFPGITALALAAVALGDSTTRGCRVVHMAIAIALLGTAFSLGTALPGYSVLHGLLPLLSGLRNVARWGWLPLAAIAIMAGYGVAALERKQWRRWQAMAATIAVMVTIEAIRTPVGYTPFNGIPAFYDRFANEPDAVIAEFPFYSGANVSLNGPYVLANTRYFKPLLNGYSSFHPDSFEARGRALNSFPSEPALAELRVAHVTHVVVHARAFERRYGDDALKAVDTIPDLQLVADENGIRLYRLK